MILLKILPEECLNMRLQKILFFKFINLFCIIIAVFSFSAPSFSKDFKFKKIGKSFSHPWGITVYNDNEVLITERGGSLFKVNIKNGSKLKIRNIPKVFNVRQGGLLDILVDQNSGSKKTVYICYSSKVANGSSTSLLSGEIKENELIKKKVLFRANNVSDSSVHFGCRLAILGDEVFMSIGDRGNRFESQDIKSHAGSIIRINKINGSSQNLNNINSWSPELFTKGHRNPQGMAVNPKTNEIWINEHGPKGGDEINIIKLGRNYGWPIVTFGEEYWGGKVGQGITTLEGFEDPIWHWVPSIAPSGMTFYNKNMFPEFKGNLLVSSLKFKSIYLVELKDGVPTRETVLFKNRFGRIRDIEQLKDGSILIISDEKKGGIYKIYR
tara:strand:+ start:314 stop:1462 length:1149 start_codon:yes stop_codon:yes gene_type:complete